MALKRMGIEIYFDSMGFAFDKGHTLGIKDIKAYTVVYYLFPIWFDLIGIEFSDYWSAVTQ